jgi:2-isopropylmalate synthase
MDKLLIFDTTLRDGEQSAGAAMSAADKMQIARQLERLRVDVIEAGFPAASRGDFAAVQAIAKAVTESAVCALARANDADIDAAAEAIAGAARGRLHTFIATSKIHLEKKLRMSEKEVLERAVAAVVRARKRVDDVEFSPEDAARSDEDFLCRVIEAAISAGASTINIPDTVGYGVPDAFGALIGRLRERVPNSDKAVFSVHCHNDLGLAVANSLAAVRAGARQVECTINGIGERAGNAALEEIVMAARTRRDVFGCDTAVDARQLLRTSRMVADITGFAVQPNKAIVGANAFAHESGIHQDGVLKDKETYEIMRAEDVGWPSNRIQLGKLSGRNALRARLADLGVVFDSEGELNEAFARFKELADKKREIFDDDLIALAHGISAGAGEYYRLLSFRSASETGETPRAEVVIAAGDKEAKAASAGSGQVDAAFRAIESVAESGARLSLYAVRAITDGSDAQGEVTVRLAKNGAKVNGHGADTDIVLASVKAYLDALNRMRGDNGDNPRIHPQRQV